MGDTPPVADKAGKPNPAVECAQLWLDGGLLDPSNGGSPKQTPGQPHYYPPSVQERFRRWVGQKVVEMSTVPVCLVYIGLTLLEFERRENFVVMAAAGLTMAYTASAGYVHWTTLLEYSVTIIFLSLVFSILWMDCTHANQFPLLIGGHVTSFVALLTMPQPLLNHSTLLRAVCAELALLISCLVMEGLQVSPPSLGVTGNAHVFIVIAAIITMAMVHKDVWALRDGAQRVVEEELARQRDSLDISRKHTDSYLAALAHELRNPLAGVYSLLDCASAWMSPQVLQQQDVRKWLDAGLRVSSRLLDSLTELLTYERTTIGMYTTTPKLCNVAKEFQELGAAWRVEADRKGVALDLASYHTTDAPSKVLVDFAVLREVVERLIDNAVKFTSSGGKVEVEVWWGPAGLVQAHLKDGAKAHMQTCREKSTWLVVQVRDSGIGLPKDTKDRAHLFDRFVQADMSTSRQFDGLGLGLVCVKRLTGLLRGLVGCENATPGPGSVFWVGVPVEVESEEQEHKDARSDTVSKVISKRLLSLSPQMPEPRCPPSPATQNRNNAQLHGLRVLCIGSSTPLLVALSTALQRWQLHVHVSSSTADALELCKSCVFHLPFHVVFITQEAQLTAELLDAFTPKAEIVCLEVSKEEAKALHVPTSVTPASSSGGAASVDAAVHHHMQWPLANEREALQNVLLAASQRQEQSREHISSETRAHEGGFHASALAVLRTLTAQVHQLALLREAVLLPLLVLPYDNITMIALAAIGSKFLLRLWVVLRQRNPAQHIFTAMFLLDFILYVVTGDCKGPFFSGMSMWSGIACIFPVWGPDRIAWRSSATAAVVAIFSILRYAVGWQALAYPAPEWRVRGTAFAACIYAHLLCTWFFNVAVVFRFVDFNEKSLQEVQRARDRVHNELAVAKRLLWVLSHEIRTPLHILGYAVDVFHNEHASLCPEPAPADLTAIKNGLGILRGLVEQSLNRERVEKSTVTVQSAAFSPRKVADTIVSLFKRSGKVVRLNTDVSHDVCVLGDQLLLGQLLTNLVSNAITHSTEECEVVVELQIDTNALSPSKSPLADAFHKRWPDFQMLSPAPPDARPLAHNSLLAQEHKDAEIPSSSTSTDTEPEQEPGWEHRVRFSVLQQASQPSVVSAAESTAAELAGDPRPRRVAQKLGGFGIGLGLSRQLARMMHGKLQLDQAAGVATLQFMLPGVEPLPTHPTPALHPHKGKKRHPPKKHASTETPSAASGTGSTPTLLVAEDNQMAQIVLRAMLDRLGVESVVVENGLLAVQAVERQPFKLVLMDINMPVMDGVEATRKIKEAHRDVPVCALTACAVDAIDVTLFREVINKPVSLKRLKTTLLTYECIVDDDEKRTPPSP